MEPPVVASAGLPVRLRSAKGAISTGAVPSICEALLGADHVVFVDRQNDVELLAFGVGPAQRDRCRRCQRACAGCPDAFVIRNGNAGADPAEAGEIGFVGAGWRKKTLWRGIFGKRRAVGQQDQIINLCAFQIDRTAQFGVSIRTRPDDFSASESGTVFSAAAGEPTATSAVVAPAGDAGALAGAVTAAGVGKKVLAI